MAINEKLINDEEIIPSPQEPIAEGSSSDIEFPDVPSATEIEDVGFFESLIPNVKIMFSKDDNSKAEIIKKSFAGDSRFGGVFSDKFGLPMIVWNDEPYYVNKPGLDFTDIATFTGEVIKYLPASRYVAGAKGLKDTVQRGITTYPATEAASIAGESLLAPETSRNKKRDFTDIGQEIGLATGIGVAADVVLPPALSLAAKGAVKGATKTATAAKSVFPRFNAEKIIEKITPDPAQKSAFPLTEGQQRAKLPDRKEGPGSRVTEQLEVEDVLRNAPGTDPSASGIMRGFDERQLGMIRAEAERLQKEFGSGTLSSAEDVPTAAAESVQNIATSGSAAIKELSSQAYNAVKTADMPPIMKPEGVLQTSKEMLDAITKGGDEGLGITARELADMPILRRELEYLKRISKIASNPKFKGQPLKVLHGYQKSLNRAARTAQAGSPEAMALNRMKGILDSSIFNGIERGLIAGDEAILKELKNATDLYRRYIGMTGKGSAKDSQERAANKILETLSNPNYTPMQVTRLLFGHAKFAPSQSLGLAIRKLKQNLGDEGSEEIIALIKDGFLEKAFSGAGTSGITRTNIVNNFNEIFVKNRKLVEEFFSPAEIKQIAKFRQDVMPTLWAEIKLNPSGTGYTVMSAMAQKGILNYIKMIPFGAGEALATGAQVQRATNVARNATSQQVDRMNKPLFSQVVQSSVRPPAIETIQEDYDSPTLNQITTSASPSLRSKLQQAVIAP
jgi:hypothetical protein